jgi:hypothetical protein
MQKKNLYRLAVILVALLGSLAALHSSPAPAENSTCKGPANCCPNKPNKSNNPGGMIWDNLSTQFISILATP